MSAMKRLSSIVPGALLAGLLPAAAWAQSAAPPPTFPEADAQQAEYAAPQRPPAAAASPGAAAPDAGTVAELLRRIQSLEEEVRQLHAPPTVPKPTSDLQTETFEARWRNAFVIQSADERFRLRVGGLIQADGRYFIGRADPPPADSLNQFLLRRARIDIEADAWRYFSFRLQPDFALGKVVLFDAYADIKPLPELRFRFGKFKVPFGLERFQPANAIIFAERGAPTEISPNRDLGVQIYGDVAGGILSYYLGVFNGNVDNSTIDAETDDDKEVAGRVFLQPFRRTSLDPLSGLGVGGGFTYGTRNGTAASPNLLAIKSFGQSQIFSLVTGNTAAGAADPAKTAVASGTRVRWTVHGSYYFRRLGLLGEYVSAANEVQKGQSRGTLNFSAWQLQATFLLTSDRASFTGVVPRRPFDPWHHGWGAVELAGRYSGLQIDSGTFDGGFADPNKSVRAARNFVVGANWYLTANTRLLFDYARTDFTSGASSGDRVPENVCTGRLQFSL